MSFETEGCTLNNVLLTVYTNQIKVSSPPLTRSRRNVIFKKLSCDARIILLFMDDQIFLPIGEAWLMHIADTHCTLAERKEAKGQRKLLYA